MVIFYRFLFCSAYGPYTVRFVQYLHVATCIEMLMIYFMYDDLVLLVSLPPNMQLSRFNSEIWSWTTLFKLIVF